MAGIMIKVRNPKPDELDDALEGFDEDKGEEKAKEEPDEDADEAAEMSALTDFLSAIGVSGDKARKGLPFLHEAISLCVKSHMKE